MMFGTEEIKTIIALLNVFTEELSLLNSKQTEVISVLTHHH